MLSKFIYAKRTDGSEAMINLDEVWYASYRDSETSEPQLYFKFSKDEVFTVAPEMARRVWELMQMHERGS